MKNSKLFVLKKYVYANNLKEALKKERTHEVDDAWWDEDHKKKMTNPKDGIGFQN